MSKEVQNVVSFSGGRTSAYLAHLIEKKRKAGEINNVHYVFMDTGAEHPKTYEFIRNCVSYFGIELTCLRAVMSEEKGVGVTYRELPLSECGSDLQPWKDMLRCYSTPYIRGAMCTRAMKTDPYEKWCKAKFGKGNWVSWLGMRIDEKTRLKPRKGIRYLAEISPMDKLDILGFWKDMPFDLGIDEWVGNCVFCIKKGINKVALAAIDAPELARQFQDMLDTAPIRIIETREDAPEIMYRGHHSFRSLKATYADFTREDILTGMRGNSGGCTESCEVFGCQGDLFDDNQ